MANDYLFLKCKYCKSISRNWAKYYPSSGIYVNKNTSESFQKWVEDHSNCAEEAGVLQGEIMEIPFEIVNEEGVYERK